jgi:acyl-CoA reductase-like NAD-dependent aldehyde dehydrogenase
MPEVTTVNPSTGRELATYPAADVEAAHAVLAQVHAGQPAWAARRSWTAPRSADS